MRRNIALALAVLLVGLYATEVKAQKVTIKNIDDSTAGQLTGTADVEIP